MERKRLGRGLDALISGNDETEVATLTENEVAVERIEHNPYQPRKTFDKEELATLSASVKTHGVLQPIVVRTMGDRFQLIAGERRLRAAQAAGLAKIPVRVVDFNDQEVLEAALVENIHRADLNPIEKAQGFREYLDRFQMNHEQLAQRLGLARSTITNLVNLLELTPEVQEGVRTNQISEAHAKLLKGVKSKERQIALFKQIVAMGLSVKATESLIREQKELPGDDVDPGSREASSTSGSNGLEAKTNHVRGIEEELKQKLATAVEIRLRGKDRGQFVIRFESNDDFLRIVEALRKS